MSSILAKQLEKYIPNIKQGIQEVTELNVGLPNLKIAEKVEKWIFQYVQSNLGNVVLRRAEVSVSEIPSTFSLVIGMMHKDSPDLIELCVFCSGAKNSYLVEIVK